MIRGDGAPRSTQGDYTFLDNVWPALRILNIYGSHFRRVPSEGVGADYLAETF